jgi:hypothetical protein
MTKMLPPLWITVPKALRWFNWRYSLPRTWLSSIKILMGLKKVQASSGKVVITCSISEDYARLWVYFASTLKHSGWKVVVVDSAGDMTLSKLGDVELIRFANLYHGRKVDVMIKTTITSPIIFLCDDDKFILSDPTDNPIISSALQNPQVAAVSLSPRRWWWFEIKGEKYLPMGSYAIIFKRDIFIRHRLTFQSPRGLRSRHKVFAEGVKHQLGYDTADYANERLLLLGYNIITLPENDYITGFDGLSAPRILLLRYGKKYVKQALLEATHFREGSINGAVIKGCYGIVKLEKLYRKIFNESLRFVSGFTEEELIDIVQQNPNIDEDQYKKLMLYFKKIDVIEEELYQHVQKCH